MEHSQDCKFQKNYLAVLTNTKDRLESIVGVRWIDRIHHYCEGEVVCE